jgi:hypothetical protein
MQGQYSKDLTQQSKVFWDVDAISIGNAVHNRTPIFSKTAVKTKILGSYCKLQQYRVTEMAKVRGSVVSFIDKFTKLWVLKKCLD